MAQTDISLGLEFPVACNLQQCITEALNANYTFVVTPVVHPRFRRDYVAGVSSIGGFTRSDMILSSQDWSSRIVANVSPYIDVDAASPDVRRRHEDCMSEELSYYLRGLGIPVVVIPIHGAETTNLTRLLLSFFDTSHHPTTIWARVPMVCKRTERENLTESNDENEDAWNVPWYWWSKFHERMEWDKRAKLALELSADLPSQEILNRWLGEPIKALFIPTTVFHLNKKGFPVLSKAHQQFVVDVVQRDAQVVITGARRANPEIYWQYLVRLWRKQPGLADDRMLTYAKGWEDYLQTPLQPLADNLDTYTYNIFEKDPVKYDQYQKAIAKALTDTKAKKVSQLSRDTPNQGPNQTGQGDMDVDVEPIIVMVLGAGRGPLVRATFNAADITGVKVKVIAVEKNPCAVVVLAAQAKEVWRDRDVIVVPGDMRQIKITNKADIIVSELLGSWGDNELSPECLDGAMGLLKPDGISIPSQYRSFVAPISSPRLWGAAKYTATDKCNHKEKNHETLWVVYMQNKHDIAEPKVAFTFEHPSQAARDHEGQEVTTHEGLPLTDNRRTATITWVANQDNVMHGFGGYFDCTLYKDEMISILPATHSPGMISWFPVFIPIRTPLRVKKGDVIKATFWRCVSVRRVWYEWLVEVGDKVTALHNCNGRSSEMLL